jgi:hypothetical protein
VHVSVVDFAWPWLSQITHANATKGNYQRSHPEYPQGDLNLYWLQQDAERQAGGPAQSTKLLSETRSTDLQAACWPTSRAASCSAAGLVVG